MGFPAHIRIDEQGNETVQTVEHHCRNCARWASLLAGEDWRNLAYLAGILHDFGKYTQAFKHYISKASRGERVKKGSVNHTFAGVHFVMERWHSAEKQSLENITSELLAIAIGGHHGPIDCFDELGKDGYAHRINQETALYEEAKAHFLVQCASLQELDDLFEKAQAEVGKITGQLVADSSDSAEMDFKLGLLARRLLSLIIEGDRRDTAEFMTGKACYSHQNFCGEQWSKQLNFMEEKLRLFPVDSAIAQARCDISEKCYQAASRGKGIYCLNVPTGGGKTLAGLRYSLAAAIEQQKQRIFFVIPLLSVLEQNAAVIRQFISQDMQILEHHSNLIQENEDTEEMEKRDLLTETWDAPIVITTFVQLLNTLFAGKTSCIRRMNALADSIIVIDEVQSVPPKMLSLFTEAMNFLACCCNATVILCSATQPGWEHLSHPIRFERPRDMIPYDKKIWKTFQRTQLIEKKQAFTVDGLADFALCCMQEKNSLLLIANTKKEAKALYEKLSGQTDAQIFHLSTGMCMAHRMKTMQEIHHCLQQKQRIICVATQLVEAGVDFSFSCVIRIAAGLDNVVQAAGRCNRNGEYGEICPVYFVRLQGEQLNKLKEIRQAQLAALETLEESQTEQNLLDDAVINRYYARLYQNTAVNTHDYALPEQNTTLFELLATNAAFWSKCRGEKKSYSMRQAFKTAGKAFQVFDDNTVDVLVPYENGAELISQMQSERGLWDFEYCKMQLAKGKQYAISLYDHEIKKLREMGGLVSLWDGKILALGQAFYDNEIGFRIEGDNYEFLEG